MRLSPTVHMPSYVEHELVEFAVTYITDSEEL